MKLILVRGLPGSGKSTFAVTVADFLWETDRYWTRPDGTYDFNPKLIKQAHKWCQGHVEVSLSMTRESTSVSNTFTQLWEMQPYIDMAEKYGAELVVYKMTGEFQNIHNVPPETIEKMKNRWEDYPGEIIVKPIGEYQWELTS